MSDFDDLTSVYITNSSFGSIKQCVLLLGDNLRLVLSGTNKRLSRGNRTIIFLVFLCLQ